MGWTLGLAHGIRLFLIPGVGPVMVAGTAVAWIVGALEGAVVVGGLSALGAGLYSIGIPRNSALKYESSVKAGKFCSLPTEQLKKRKWRAKFWQALRQQKKSMFTNPCIPMRRLSNLEAPGTAICD